MEEFSGRQEFDFDVGQKDSVASMASAPIVCNDAGVVAVSVHRSLYSTRVVLAAAYKLSDRWAVLVDDDGPDRWKLYLLGLTPDGARAGLTTLVHELTDQAVRERLDEETRDLRTLLVAQAFSEGNLLDPTRDAETLPIDSANAQPHR